MAKTALIIGTLYACVVIASAIVTEINTPDTRLLAPSFILWLIAALAWNPVKERL